MIVMVLWEMVVVDFRYNDGSVDLTGAIVDCGTKVHARKGSHR